MRQYETVFLIAPTLSEEEKEAVIDNMAEVVSNLKGKMMAKEEWGKRKLAYTIKKFEEAYYVLFHYEGKPEIPGELERRFKQSEAIIRYLTVKKEIRENIRLKRKAREVEKAASVSEQKKRVNPQAESSPEAPEKRIKEG
ncbi:MAG: 30S ribosomal protein S6 [Candidatus Aminicenantales bacterium]